MMARGNQINLGETAGIDTDEVQSWEMGVDKEQTPVTIVGMKNTAVLHLHGDNKLAFDAWAESLRPVAEAGQRELCATCGFRNVRSECKNPMIDGGIMGYPECYENEDA